MRWTISHDTVWSSLDNVHTYTPTRITHTRTPLHAYTRTLIQMYTLSTYAHIYAKGDRFVKAEVSIFG